ncbi:hypothetical protein ABGB17_23610 [Sphaerisporangium sp. B11E5]|uniref:hypothetical protein n=1 Tax=Sphaerisporangium sp. B11E5 TaxID=3153563 RepID=UPI00325F57DA
MNQNRHHRSTATVLGAAFIGCLITALTACAAPGSGDTGASAEGAPAPQPSATGPVPGQADQVRLTVLAGQVEEHLRQNHPDQYAGVVLNGDKLLVYRVPSKALDASLSAEFPDAPLRLRDAAHSARRLEALAQRVTGDIDYWTRKGVPITTVAPLADGSAVEVGTTDTEKASAELPERYGPVPLKFTEADPALPLPGATPS